jgi:hypothetical protein
VFRRLVAEHNYPGGYDQVRRYTAKRRRRARETFIPLAHDPGQRLECDFGHIHVDFPDGRRQVAVLMPTWSYSNCPFAIALPRLPQTTEGYGGRPHRLKVAYSEVIISGRVWLIADRRPPLGRGGPLGISG